MVLCAGFLVGVCKHGIKPCAAFVSNEALVMMLSAWATVWWCVGLSVGLLALDVCLAARLRHRVGGDARSQARARRVAGGQS